jgi:hypothetical protein
MNNEGIAPIIDTVCNLAFCSFLDNVRSGEGDRRNNLNLRQIRHRLRKSLAQRGVLSLTGASKFAHSRWLPGSALGATFQLRRDCANEHATECGQIKTNIRSISDRHPDAPKSWLSTRGANHYMFSEDGAMLKSPLLMGTLHALRIAPSRDVATSQLPHIASVTFLMSI